MSLQVPVIATNAGGHPEIIDHMVSGILVEKENSTAIAKAAIKIFEDPSFKNSLIENGKNKSRTSYSVATCVTSVRKIYNSFAIS